MLLATNQQCEQNVPLNILLNFVMGGLRGGVFPISHRVAHEIIQLGTKPLKNKNPV